MQVVTPVSPDIHPVPEAPSDDAGQTTAEYALVLLGAAAIAGLLVKWATGASGLTKLNVTGAAVGESWFLPKVEVYTAAGVLLTTTRTVASNAGSLAAARQTGWLTFVLRNIAAMSRTQARTVSAVSNRRCLASCKSRL